MQDKRQYGRVEHGDNVDSRLWLDIAAVPCEYEVASDDYES